MIEAVQPRLWPADVDASAAPRDITTGQPRAARSQTTSSGEGGALRRNGKHPRNQLNELSGDEWIFFTKSVLSTVYPSDYGHRLRKAHGANKPPQLMRSLIEFFTTA